jgi:hypothetical protein
MYYRDSTFKELKVHYETGKGMICLQEFGEKDPIVEFSDRLKRSKDDWKLGRKLEPKTRIIAPVIVRGEEDKGVRLWEFGTQVYKDLLSFISDAGDFTDPITGRDFTVEVTSPEQNKTKYNQTSARIRINQTPLSKDAAQVKNWLENQPNPMDVYRKYTYDEMKKFLEDYLNPENAAATTDASKEQSVTINKAEPEATGLSLNRPAVTTPKKKVETSEDIDEMFKV